MLTEKEQNLLMLLELPHRISNPRAMMNACTEAAATIKRLAAELEKQDAPAKPKAKAAPKRARNTKGQLKADDPSTPDVNEAWESGKAPKS